MKAERRYVIVSRSWGVFLGSEDSLNPLPMGYWSNRNPWGRMIAPTFKTMDDVQRTIGEWTFLRYVPSDLSYVPVRSILLNGRWVATRIACIESDIPGWS